MIDKEVFAKNLCELMKRDNISQVELAHKLSLTKSAINCWCNGKSVPKVKYVQTLADIFCCSADEILFERTTPFPTGTPEERLVTTFRSLNEQGQHYLLQQASIASVMYSKNSSVPSEEVTLA